MRHLVIAFLALLMVWGLAATALVGFSPGSMGIGIAQAVDEGDPEEGTEGP